MSLAMLPHVPEPSGVRGTEGTTMFSRRKRLVAAVAIGLAALTLGACSSGGASSNQPSAAAAGGGTVSTPKYKFAMISHAPAGDAFFDVIQQGAKDAAAKDNV